MKWLGFALCMLIVSAAAFADPPARVGRIGYLEGNVSLSASDQEEDQWVAAELNYPIIAGNALRTDRDGRAEIQIAASSIHIDRSSEIEVVQLDDDTIVLRVDRGVANIRVGGGDTNSIAVLTPAGQVDLTQGRYHIEVDDTDDGPTQVTTFKGTARVETDRAGLQLRAGESAVIGGSSADVSLVEGVPSEFDDWVAWRVQREQDRVTTHYVSPATTGYVDLDSAGRWDDDPEYGGIWYPSVATDWAPYRYGHWAFIEPWGWTWVDAAPWGFAPFHYGRWVYVHNTWGWCPGERVARPVYAPALVVFVGNEHHSVEGSRERPHAWIPLGPHEPYRPNYRVGDDYLHGGNGDRNGHGDTHDNRFRNQTALTVANNAMFQHPRQWLGATQPRRSNSIPRDADAMRNQWQDDRRAPASIPKPSVERRDADRGERSRIEERMQLDRQRSRPPMPASIAPVNSPSAQRPQAQVPTQLPRGESVRHEPVPMGRSVHEQVSRGQDAHDTAARRNEQEAPRRQAEPPHAAPQLPHPGDPHRGDERHLPQAEHLQQRLRNDKG